MAHIGVIRWLEQNGYAIHSISGCSIGALIGGIHARDKLDEYEQWVRAISKFDIINLLDIAWGKQGLVEGERIMSALRDLVGDCEIEDLPIKFTAVATDLTEETEVWLSSGLLFDSIRASISLPLFFSPHELNGRHLLDGGILNPVPIEPTIDDDTDLTIVVNLGAAPEHKIRPTLENDLKNTDSDSSQKALLPADNFQSKIAQFIKGLTNSQSSSDTGGWSMLDIADQTFDAMQASIARQKLAAHPPDHIIEIARDACGTLEFDRADEMIELGFNSAERSLKSN